MIIRDPVWVGKYRIPNDPVMGLMISKDLTKKEAVARALRDGLLTKKEADARLQGVSWSEILRLRGIS
ncbi:MAG: hypothetical protein OXG58_07120 [Gemmatimonadetes bacterium]|nr:hypothetical protein [Gemmatimonadota bacterium]MCY3943917.1 hypothetical protein [Gemmatimonadota bacterium]